METPEQAGVWQVTTQIVQAVHQIEASTEEGNLKLVVFVQDSGELIARIFHIAAPGQGKILDALTGGLTIPTLKTPKDL